MPFSCSAVELVFGMVISNTNEVPGGGDGDGGGWGGGDGGRGGGGDGRGGGGGGGGGDGQPPPRHVANVSQYSPLHNPQTAFNKVLRALQSEAGLQ